MYKLIILILSLSLATNLVFGQKRTRNNYSGIWNNNISWRTDPGNATTTFPDPTNLGDPALNIYGSITRSGSLNFPNVNDSRSITIYDTLIVTEDMSFGNKAMNLVVSSSGLLIVLGNFYSQNKVQVDNGGKIVIKGDMEFDGGQSNDPTTYDKIGTGELFVLGTVTGNTEAYNHDVNSGSLQTKYPAIYEFVMNNGTVPLPIDLLTFSSTNLGGSMKLYWSTISERNFDYFTIERSINAVDFEEIGIVKGAGNSNSITNYEFIDKNYSSEILYYRLKATDFDGTSEYFNVIEARAESINTRGLVYPNPLNGDEFYIDLPTDSGNEAEGISTVYSSQGIVVLKERIVSGVNKVRLKESLKAGVYIVLIQSGEYKRQARLFIY